MFAYLRRKVAPMIVEEDGIDPKWFGLVMEALRFTPDAGDLYTQEYHLLFAYNGLMKNGVEHWRVKETCLLNPSGQPMRWRAYTKDDFSVWTKDERTRLKPVALQPTDHDHPMWSATKRAGLNRAPPAKVKGELYLVPPDLILKLDIDHKNGIQFKRIPIHVYIPERRVHWLRDPASAPGMGEHLSSTFTSDFHLRMKKAWMYVGVQDYWEPVIDAGFSFSPTPCYQPKKQSAWLSRYYHFKDR